MTRLRHRPARLAQSALLFATLLCLGACRPPKPPAEGPDGAVPGQGASDAPATESTASATTRTPA